jgi:hypothetical protein
MKRGIERVKGRKDEEPRRSKKKKERNEKEARKGMAGRKVGDWQGDIRKEK